MVQILIDLTYLEIAKEIIKSIVMLIIIYFVLTKCIIPIIKKQVQKYKRKTRLKFNEFEDIEKIRQEEIENEQLKNEWETIEKAYNEKYNFFNRDKAKKHLRAIKFMDTFESDDEQEIPEGVPIARALEDDNTFDAELFKKWSNNIFEYIQIGTEKELEQIKTSLDEPLYDRKIKQMHNFQKDNIELKREDLLIEDTKIIDYGRWNDKAHIKIYIKAMLKEYIINKKTLKVLRGSKKKINERSFIMTFEKRESEKQVGFVRNCQNCGATVSETEFGRCSYCGSLVNPIRYNWTLIKYETI